jgi:hypothetical protein
MDPSLDLQLYPVDPKSEPVQEPPGLLASLAHLGVSFLDGDRWLLAQVPHSARQSTDWPQLEQALASHSRSLQLMASAVTSTRLETPPDGLLERIRGLHAECLPALVQTLGGTDGLSWLSAEEVSPAVLDLAYAAYLRGLTYQVVHGLEPEEGPRLGELLDATEEKALGLELGEAP